MIDSRLSGSREAIREQLVRCGAVTGIWRNGKREESLLPLDPLPRVIEAQAFARLERGLLQRVAALNAFLRDVYGEKRIFTDGVIPPEAVFAGKGYLPQCEGSLPPEGVYVRLAGIDLAEGKDGWTVLCDNLRIPGGAALPLVARIVSRRCAPRVFQEAGIADSRDYGGLLRDAMNSANRGGLNVLLTPGTLNASYFEHAVLAEQAGLVLSESRDLIVRDGFLFLRCPGGDQRVGALYRFIADEWLDPLSFSQDSLIGIPGLMTACRAGNVALLNAPGCSAADDPGIFARVPDMIRYYLGEEPLLPQTALPFSGKAAREYLDDAAAEALDADGKPIRCGANLRAFVLWGREPRVWKSGLTRFYPDPAGAPGFKDTWVRS